MARPRKVIPSYLPHKPSGQARVRINGRDFYLGEYGSPESMAQNHRLLAEHFSGSSNGEMATVVTTESDVWTVAMLAVKYDEFARSYYVKNGEATDTRYQAGIEPIVNLYGGVPVNDFGPKKLIATREYIIARGNPTHRFAARIVTSTRK